jgi:hypothetical protein
MASTVNWQLEPTLIEQIQKLAQQRGQQPESILTEAILLYLEAQPNSLSPDMPQAIALQHDPLVGLFSGTSNLATQAENILEGDRRSRNLQR